VSTEREPKEVGEAEICSDDRQRSVLCIREDLVVGLTANAEIDDVICLKASRLKIGD
jgi:hypothetical protein